MGPRRARRRVAEGVDAASGLAFVSVSEKAWRLAEKAKNAAFYFNFKKEREAEQKNQTAYTAAVSLMRGLKEVQQMLRGDGRGHVFASDDGLAPAMRQQTSAAGVELSPTQRHRDGAA